MYYSIFEILQNAIYGAVALTGWQELFLTTVSSSCVLFVVAVPFLVVWEVIKIIWGR